MAGLYAVLWGKYKESQEAKKTEAMAFPLAYKDNGISGQALYVTGEDAQEEMDWAKPNGASATKVVASQVA